MSDRYFVASPIAGSRAVLSGPEAHHLLHVMRAKPGDEVTLFDGTGQEFDARTVKLGRSEVELEVLSSQEVDRELPFQLVMAVSLPKGDRQKWLVEKATELGVTQLVPLESKRSVAQPTESALERLRRSVIEASKQCGRNRLMEVADPVGLEKLITLPQTDGLRLIAHPGGLPLDQTFDQSNLRGKTICCLVGPEGGFTEGEAASASEADWQRISLGSRILRIETAALAVASCIALQGIGR